MQFCPLPVPSGGKRHLGFAAVQPPTCMVTLKREMGKTLNIYFQNPHSMGLLLTSKGLGKLGVGLQAPRAVQIQLKMLN